MEMEMDHMRDVLLATNNARCHNKSVRPSSLLSLPAPSRFMTLAYSFAASLAGRRTQRPSDGTEGGREGETALAANANTDTCACAAVAGRPPSPLLSCLRERARPARRGRDGLHSGWVDPQKRRADHGRRTDLSRRSLARRCLPYPNPPPLSLSFLPFGPFQVLAFHSRVLRPPTVSVRPSVRPVVFPYLFRHPGRASPLRRTSGRTSARARPLPLSLSPSLK